MSDSEFPEADPPDEVDVYTLVLLYRSPKPPDLDDKEGDRLQRQHLGHLEAMHRRGALLLWGPFSDQPDQTLRGICIYRLGLEEARHLAESDPIVRRGWLTVVAFKWYTRSGALHVEGPT